MKMLRRTVLTILCILIALCPFAACENRPEEAAAPASTQAPTLAPSPSPAPAMIAVPTPTPVPSPTPTETPEPSPTPTPTPVPATDPVIALTGGESFVVNAAFTFEDPGATAKDYLGVDLTDRITVEGAVVPYLVGEYTLTYAVTDDYGRRTEVQRTVSVVPVTLPEVIDPPPKTIYLTFDDGPSAYTEHLLNILKKYDVKATFFVLGKASKKELIKRAYEEGHSIGVHTYTHEYETIYASEEAFFADFLATEEVIKEQTGQYTTLFRFPGGSANTVSRINPGIITRLAKIMEDMGYRYFDWNLNSGDARTNSPAESGYYNSVLQSSLKKDGSPTFVLQHDTKYFSVDSLNFFIPWALRNGYTFLPLDMTSPVIHSKIAN